MQQQHQRQLHIINIIGGKFFSEHERKKKKRWNKNEFVGATLFLWAQEPSIHQNNFQCTLFIEFIPFRRRIWCWSLVSFLLDFSISIWYQNVFIYLLQRCVHFLPSHQFISFRWLRTRANQISYYAIEKVLTHFSFSCDLTVSLADKYLVFIIIYICFLLSFPIFFLSDIVSFVHYDVIDYFFDLYLVSFFIYYKDRNFSLVLYSINTNWKLDAKKNTHFYKLAIFTKSWKGALRCVDWCEICYCFLDYRFLICL